MRKALHVRTNSTLIRTLRGLLVAASVIALMGASSDGCSTDTDSSVQGKAKAVGTVGKPVKNAGTTYKVTKVQTLDRIGDPSLGGAKAEAGAKLVVITLQLTNTKKKTATIDESNAKIVSKDGTSYSTSDKLELAFDSDQNMFLKQIQPGLTTTGKLGFEVPKAKLKGAKLVIADIFGNGHVDVKLGL